MGAALHHQARAARGDVRDDGFAPVKAHGFTEIDRKHEIDHGPGRPAQRLDFENYTHG